MHLNRDEGAGGTVKRHFDIGDRVVLVPEYAMVFDATEEDLRAIHVVTQVEQGIGEESTEFIWLDDEPTRQAAMYYRKIRG